MTITNDNNKVNNGQQMTITNDNQANNDQQ